VSLRCPEPDAAAILRGCLKEVLEYLEREHLTVERTLQALVTPDGVSYLVTLLGTRARVLAERG
jgi:hypothetical protein